MNKLDRPPLLSQSVREAIQAHILNNGLQPGDLLPAENELARQLGVSRNSVREAIKALESLGILDIRRGSGTYVCDFSFEPLLDNLHYGLLFNLDELVDLLEIRRALETGMIHQVIPLRSQTQLDMLQSILNQMRLRAENGESFPEEDRLFHQILFGSLGNRALIRLLDIFWLAFHKAIELKTLSNWDKNSLQTYHDHVAIVAALQASDSAAARHALDRHYNGIVERIAEAKAYLEGQKDD